MTSNQRAALQNVRANRRELLSNIRTALSEQGVPLMVRGPVDSLEAWLAGSDDDLDLWAKSSDLPIVLAVIRWLGLVPLRGLTSSRPRHLVCVDTKNEDFALVEWLIGPLVARSTELLSEEAVAVAGQFTPTAVIVDNVIRRVLMGKPINVPHASLAQHAWIELGPDDRDQLNNICSEHLSRRNRRAVKDLLAGDPLAVIEPESDARGAIRLAQTRSGRRSMRSAARSRLASVAPRIAGAVPRGTLVVLIGTDGSGKTSTSRALAGELRSFGLRVDTIYFGRTRGNLPGVGALRRRIERSDPGVSASEPRSAPQRFSALRRLGSWYYAGEYAIRFWANIAPRLALGHIVVLDRFVYDLSVMPHGSPVAASVARRMVKAPDLLLLLDAPADEIHARKPERTIDAIKERQATFSRVLRTVPARYRGTVSTSSHNGTLLSRVSDAALTVAMRAHLPDEIVTRAVADVNGFDERRDDTRREEQVLESLD